MSTLAIVAIGWMAVCCLGLIAMSFLGRAGARADQDSESWARAMTMQRGLRILPGHGSDADAACPDCAIVVRATAAGTACPSCSAPLVALPRIVPAAPRRQVG